jgi:hypothetical protein
MVVLISSISFNRRVRSSCDIELYTRIGKVSFGFRGGGSRNWISGVARDVFVTARIKPGLKPSISGFGNSAA